MSQNTDVRARRLRLTLVAVAAWMVGLLGLFFGSASATPALDKTFVNEGVQITDFGKKVTAETHRIATVLKPNGTIIGLQSAGGRFHLAKFAKDGSSMGSVLMGHLETRLTVPGGLAQQGNNSLVASAGQNVNRGKIYLQRRLNDGSLDPSFGDKGTVTVFAHPGKIANDGISQVEAIAVDDAGRIYVAATVDRQVVLRFTAEGSLDQAFGDDGRLSPPSQGTSFRKLTPRSEGLYVATLNGLYRVTEEGQIDSSFDSGLPSDGTLRDFEFLNDGKILALNGYILRRLKQDGSLDRTFGTDGSLAPRCGGIGPRAFALDHEGRIVLAGGRASSAAHKDDTVAVRLLPDGACDPGFGSNGRFSFKFSRADDWADEVLAYPDGNLLLTGGLPNGGYSEPSFQARLTAEGKLDTSFGTGGWTRLKVELPENDRLADLIETPDQGLVAVGSSGYSGAIARYLPDGKPDPGFGTDGKLTLGWGSNRATRVKVKTAVALPGGHIVVCIDWKSGVRIARLDRAGNPVPSFGNNGIKRLRGFWACDGIATQGKSRLLIAGRVGDGSAVTRVHGNGKLDRRFGRKGLAKGPSRRSGPGIAFATGPNGSSYIAGPHSMVKFRPNGRLDKSFAQAGVLHFDGKKGRPWAGRFRSLAIDNDGSLYLARQAVGGKFLVYKRKSNGSRAAGYGFGDYLFLGTKGGRSVLGDIAIQPDGKLVLVGQVRIPCSFSTANCARMSAIYRLSAGGKVDKSWGKGLVGQQVGDRTFAAAVITREGKVTLGGTAATSRGRDDFFLARYVE